MIKKASVVRRKRSVTRPAGKLRLRDEFRDYARSAILEAGEEVLASQGVHVARMEDVAQRARVAVGTIYNLIGDRDALVAEILRVRHEEIVALLTAKLEAVQALPFREQAEACVSSMFSYFREHSRFFRLVAESEGGPSCAYKRHSQATVASMRALYQELIARGIRQNVVRAEGSELYPVLLLGMMRSVMVHDLESQPLVPAEERVAQVLAVFMHGVGAS